jgi:ferredoxin-NADP reductase
MDVEAGQFFTFRFLSGPGWTRAHPYSLSAAPDGRSLRITAKALGDGSSRLARLRPGTRVMFEGPYGRLSSRVRTRRRVLLVGAGVGITPIRALLQELPAGVDVEVVLRASRPDELVLGDEIAEHVRRRGGRVHPLVGSRHEIPLDAPALLRLVPDVADRDVYLCGPQGFAEHVADGARAAGVPKDAIHFESFSL